MSSRAPGRAQSLRGVARNRAVLRVVAGYALFTVAEYTVWAALLVVAYARGGASEAGFVALAQLVPAALLAPAAASLADRRSPRALLVGGYWVQTLGTAVAATALATHAPMVVAYGGAVVASTAVATTRPAQASLLPGLAVTPGELTAANVVVGWLEALGILVAGLALAAVLATTVPAAAFAGGTALTALAAVLVPRGRAAPPAPAGPRAAAPRLLAEVAGAGRRVVAAPRTRLLVALLAGRAVVVGALDVLFVVLAVDVLQQSQAWVGTLNAVYGLGAVLAGLVTPLLVGRRLGAPVAGAALLLAGGLGVLAAVPTMTATLVLLVVVGGAQAVLDVAARTLLQRTVPATETARTFGLVEGLLMAGLAAGALLAPALAGLGGSSLALAGVAVVMLLAATAGGRVVFRADSGVHLPIVEIALLRSLPIFGQLPPTTLEGLADALTPRVVSPGTVVVREGEPGHSYYAIAAGTLEATQGGGKLRRLGRGEGFGEIALLRDVPRTATVTAVEASTVYELDREPFLAAVTGHPVTRGAADAIVEDRLATRPGAGPAAP
jgi:hypothetical protein